MISIIITTYKEKNTLPKAIQAILDNIYNIRKEEFLPEGQMFEILVVGPDEETAEIVKNFQFNLLMSADLNNHSKQRILIKYLKDDGRGKPAALNLAFKTVKGEIFVLTDGDVRIGDNSLKYLLKPFFEKEANKVGAVSGHPLPLNSRNDLFGYWSHFLTDAAHQMRINANPASRDADKREFPCSGYLYAIRAGLIEKVPENVLAEDAFITEIIRSQGYQIIYAPEAIVYVKYPNNFKDWLKQKVRSVGGNIQFINYPDVASGSQLYYFNFYKVRWDKSKRITNRMRNFWQEIKDGLKLFFTYPKNLKEFWWTILLYLARIYLWLLIFWKLKIKRQSFHQIWQRIETTK
jgi:cellulose synthase/poly-beta-1,6-N-acetylglucosamine synthase-like glycosyltransferase